MKKNQNTADSIFIKAINTFFNSYSPRLLLARCSALFCHTRLPVSWHHLSLREEEHANEKISALSPNDSIKNLNYRKLMRPGAIHISKEGKDLMLEISHVFNNSR